MVNKVLKGAGLLIGGYLVVRYATGSGKVISAGARGGSGVIRTLQGR